MKNFKVYIKNKGFNFDKDFNDLPNEEYWTLWDEITLNIGVVSNMVEHKTYFPISAEFN